jgi:hypothetical protein
MSAAFEFLVLEMFRKAELHRQAHLRARFAWARTASVLLAAIAVVGALSGGSALASYAGAAAVLGVLTALLAGTNAGLRPAERAADHRTAAVGYGEVVRCIERLLCDRAEGPLDWSETRARLIEFEAQLSRIEASAPSVRPRPAEARKATKRVNFILTGEPGDEGDANVDP